MISSIKDTHTTQIQQYQKSELVKTEADKQANVNPGNPGISEKVDLSSTAKDIQQIRKVADQTADTREVKVQELKNQIESGKYQVDAGKVAEKMFGESLIDLFT